MKYLVKGLRLDDPILEVEENEVYKQGDIYMVGEFSYQVEKVLDSNK